MLEPTKLLRIPPLRKVVPLATKYNRILEPKQVTHFSQWDLQSSDTKTRRLRLRDFISFFSILYLLICLCRLIYTKFRTLNIFNLANLLATT